MIFSLSFSFVFESKGWFFVHSFVLDTGRDDYAGNQAQTRHGRGRQQAEAFAAGGGGCAGSASDPLSSPRVAPFPPERRAPPVGSFNWPNAGWPDNLLSPRGPFRQWTGVLPGWAAGTVGAESGHPSKQAGRVPPDGRSSLSPGPSPRTAEGPVCAGNGTQPRLPIVPINGAPVLPGVEHFFVPGPSDHRTTGPSPTKSFFGLDAPARLSHPRRS